MYYRPILKWPGGKFRLLDHIIKLLPNAEQLIEPFVGSGVVFLNTDYDVYQLSDCNLDLINLYTQLKENGQAFIRYAQQYFIPKYNQVNQYYALRESFNASHIGIERAALFLYLNRHGFNGLCRYNRSGLYNVPYGQYTSPYFPEQEMIHFAKKSQRATFRCSDFTETLSKVTNKSVVYADPPYVPLSDTAYFTQYSGGGFALPQQNALAEIAQKLSHQGVAVLLSNHDTPFTRQAYTGAHITSIEVLRSISANKKGRKHVKEILALYLPHDVNQLVSSGQFV
jgi:DNA adenine methylase